MAPFLSICVLTYNRAATLRETLDSILPQVAAFPDVEVQVSDNASTDGTEAMMREYAARHPQLRYLRKPENTLFDGNFVFALENSAGEYTAFFSDDDIAPPGWAEKLVAGLREVRPAVMYTNHTPFYFNDPTRTGGPTQPEVRKVFTHPVEYFLYTGLGFISSIVLLTAEARRHIPKAVQGRGMAYVDISSRTVLASKGPYLFDGTMTVLGRYEEHSRYDVLTAGVVAGSLAHEDLCREGLLRQEDVDWFNRKSIQLFLPRCIVNNRLNRDKPLPAAELRKVYGRYPEFYKIAYPLALIPAPLARLIFRPLRAIMRVRRKRRAERGDTAPAKVHLAPPSP